MKKKILDERLTVYRILDLYNLINKESQFNKAAFVKSSGASERTVRRDIKCLNDYFKRNYEDNGLVDVCREISYCRKDNIYRVNLRCDYDFSESDIYAFAKVKFNQEHLQEKKYKEC